MPANPAAATSHPLRGAWPAVAGLAAVFLFEMLDNSVLNVALPTIGRDLNASATDLQWVTTTYALVLGGLMLALGALADRSGRRRMMLVGLVLLAVASLATALVTTPAELIAVRAAMGVAAAMTTPGTIGLAFRLFNDDAVRVRAITLISTVGLVGLAVGPTAGGLALAVVPWQALLIANAPVALLAFAGIRAGVPEDTAADLHHDPIDVAGALVGTAAIVLALVAPTLLVDRDLPWWTGWATAAGAVACIVLFVLRQRTARHPLLESALLARPLVSSGLAFKAASGLAVAAIGYLVALQLQLEWRWPPALAAIGLLPQVIVLIAGGPFVSRFTDRVGLERAAWLSASAVVAGLAVYAVLGRFGYVFIAVALVLEAAGMRVVGVVAGVNVMRGLPATRTTIGAALVDTATQVATGVGVAVAGTVLAATFQGPIAAARWSATQIAQFQQAVTVGGLTLTVVAAALVAWAIRRSRGAVAA